MSFKNPKRVGSTVDGDGDSDGAGWGPSEGISIEPTERSGPRGAIDSPWTGRGTGEKKKVCGLTFFGVLAF